MLHIECGTGRYLYKNIASENMPYMLVPILLPNQLIISLTSQEYIYRQKQVLDPPPVGFEMQLQSIALQNELQREIKSRTSTQSEIHKAGDVTIIEQKISKLETKYRQKRQQVEQQKQSMLVTKDLLQMSNVIK